MVLPEETLATTTTSTRRVLALLLGVCLLLVAANEGARRVLRVATPNIGYALVPQKWQLLLERSAPVDWLVMGDSSCNQGVDPWALSDALGGDALNLCTVATSLAVDAAWMLETHIERLGPPGQVLLVHAYHVWHRALPPFATAHVPLPFGFWRELEPRLEAGAGWSLESFVARYLPLYAEHRSLAQLLMRPWQAKRHYRVDERGFLAASVPLPAGVDRDARRRLDWLAGIDGLGVSPENRAALERIGALADQHGFDVYLVNAPVYRGIAEAPAFRRHQRHVAALLAGVDERYARVRYVPREFHFERAVMQNGDHLLADAAKGYTRGLAAEIVRLRHAEQLADAKRPPR